MSKMRSLTQRMIICLGILLAVCISKDCQAINYFSVDAKVKSKTTVEISWKKKSVSGYEIYRAKCNKDWEVVGKYQKIATVSSKKTKYIDKKAKYKQRYSYMVKAYKKKNNKKSYKYKGDVSVYTTMTKPNWDECQFSDGLTSPNSIQLTGYTDGILPDGYEIYRKTASSKYKKIKTVKSKKYVFTYTDVNVTKGTKYTYKFRSYKKINGKKIYSKYSTSVTLNAVNRDATYTMKNYTLVNGKTTSIVIGLTSNAGNGTTIFEYPGDDMCCYYSRTEKSENLYWTNLVPIKYSYDNITWNEYPEKGVELKENQTIYLMLAKYDSETGEVGEEFDFYVSDVYDSEIEWYLTYNDRHAILDIDFIKSEASAKADGEYYH